MRYRFDLSYLIYRLGIELGLGLGLGLWLGLGFRNRIRVRVKYYLINESTGFIYLI